MNQTDKFCLAFRVDLRRPTSMTTPSEKRHSTRRPSGVSQKPSHHPVMMVSNINACSYISMIIFRSKIMGNRKCLLHNDCTMKGEYIPVRWHTITYCPSCSERFWKTWHLLSFSSLFAGYISWIERTTNGKLNHPWWFCIYWLCASLEEFCMYVSLSVCVCVLAAI